MSVFRGLRNQRRQQALLSEMPIAKVFCCELPRLAGVTSSSQVNQAFNKFI